MIAIAPSILHACALLDDGNVKCFGNNDYGALGIGDKLPRLIGDMGNNLPVVSLGTGRTATAISTGRYASCALLDNGSVKCWGFREQLGLLRVGDFCIGDEPEEMGDNLLPIDLGEGRTATQITMGYSRSCALLDDGNVRCWSSGESRTIEVDGPAVAELAIATSRPIARYQDGTFGPIGDPPVDAEGGKAVRLFGAGDNVCALLDTGNVACSGMLGSGSWYLHALGPDITGVGVFQFGNEFCTLSNQGQVWCPSAALGPPNSWQKTDALPGPLGLDLVDLGDSTAIALGNGSFGYACALLEGGTVKCWGYSLLERGYPDPISALDFGTHWVQ